ncbi:MAG: CapA family protein [Lachnospiraceae bacterium]|nr:CapA family protein [Lachnospiraceae bacterium]
MKRKKYRRKSNFIKPFLITLTCVVALGIFFIFSYMWITADRSKEYQNFQTTKEKISEEEIQEIIEQNDKYSDILWDEEYMVENNIYAKEAKNEGCVTITFAGDILFDPEYGVMAALQLNGGNISNGILPDVIEEMKSADIMMLNNEFPYSNAGTPTEGKQFTFRADPSYVSYLHDLGVDIVSLANNHAYDYGEEAFLDTMSTLKAAGIPYVGAGANEQEAMRPVYYIINDMKIAFVSATQIEKADYPDTKGAEGDSPGVFRCWDGEKLLQVVAEAKENSDFVIVYVHWGTESQEETDWAQDKQAPELVEAGADIIIGSHPHILQKIDVIKGVPVVYSLGNFWFNSKTVDTGMVKITVSEDGLQSIRFIPCLQNDYRTTLVTGEEKERILGVMRNMSENVQIDADGYVTWN